MSIIILIFFVILSVKTYFFIFFSIGGEWHRLTKKYAEILLTFSKKIVISNNEFKFGDDNGQNFNLKLLFYRE